ncbi:MAG TPA: glyoxalase [Oceanicaulis sp.]|jgi:predicted enzyme related to lactoylglutathione lyase|nr:VOC family protein [Synechococcus moorigangaii CMS01]HCY54915.1 glyoxalase [Oceanicaulis sp.]
MIPKPQEIAVVFNVADIERTERFYRDTLGLDVTRQEGAEPFWLIADLTAGSQLIFFQSDDVRPGNTPIVVFDLKAGGIDDLITALAEQGVTIVTPVSEAPGGWSADFLDPDGNALAFWQRAEVPRSLKG